MKPEIIRALKSMWAVERHAKGGLGVLPLVEILARNYERWKNDRTDEGWEILALVPTLEEGREYERELKKQRAWSREQRAEDGGRRERESKQLAVNSGSGTGKDEG